MPLESNTLIVGTRKGLLVLERAPRGWRVAREAHIGIPVPFAIVDWRSGALWASLDHGHWGQKLSRSKNGGVKWEEIPAPKYAEGDEVKPGVPATLRYIWVIAPGGAGEPNRIYLGTEPGGLFRSDDGGKSFQIVGALWAHPSRKTQWFGGGRDHPGIHSVWVDPRDSRRVLVGISCAGVFETVDDGASWTPRNKGLVATYLPDPHVEVGHDPHVVAVCASAPDVLWQQNHCGIFRSEDGAATWDEITDPDGPARFGFAIAADPVKPATAWVVPAASDEIRVAIGGGLCVCRTDDGGKRWKTHRKGLPQKNAYDVVYRHGLDVAGDRIAFGSTTGNLYVSENRGESWSLVSGNLPPIYSVRFAPRGWLKGQGAKSRARRSR